MKTNMLKLTAIMLLLAGSLASCEKEDILTLKGTQWKLAGIVDEIGALTELEPKDCAECYTLIFDTDSTLLGRSSTNEMNGKYVVDYKIQTIDMLYSTATYVNETGDGDLYIESFSLIHSFSLQQHELKLYYNEKKEYLLFKQ